MYWWYFIINKLSRDIQFVLPPLFFCIILNYYLKIWKIIKGAPPVPQQMAGCISSRTCLFRAARLWITKSENSVMTHLRYSLFKFRNLNGCYTNNYRACDGYSAIFQLFRIKHSGNPYPLVSRNIYSILDP